MNRAASARRQPAEIESIVEPVFTIGYEQSTASAFFDALKDAKVGLLVDVRAVAASRRPGFSKRQLSAGLDEHGIRYVHLQKLGTPKEGRLAARSGRAGEMLRIYERHLKTPEAQEQLEELTALARMSKDRSGGPLCLLCYERDPAHCHRQRLADELHARLGMRIEHLFCTAV
jgi:uncharacterized protein (DUF488 family)